MEIERSELYRSPMITVHYQGNSTRYSLDLIHNSWPLYYIIRSSNEPKSSKFTDNVLFFPITEKEFKKFHKHTLFTNKPKEYYYGFAFQYTIDVKPTFTMYNNNKHTENSMYKSKVDFTAARFKYHIHSLGVYIDKMKDQLFIPLGEEFESTFDDAVNKSLKWVEYQLASHAELYRRRNDM